MLPFIAFGMLFGALQPHALGDSPALWWWLLGLPLAVSAVFVRRRQTIRNLALFSAACLLGMAWRSPFIVDRVEHAPRLIDVQGGVGTIGWQGLRQGFLLLPARAEKVGEYLPPERLWVVGPGLPALRSGDVARVRGTLDRDVRGDRVDAVAIDVVTPRETGTRGWSWRAIDGLGDHKELAGALLLGQGSPPEKKLFREAGLLHVLAVSGMHFVIAGALAGWLLRLFGFPWLARVLLVTALMLGYLWLTGANPATQRAAAMSIAFLAAALLAREPHRLAAVSLAALVLIVINPDNVVDHGFQFSLAAVLGIVTLGSDLMNLRQRALPLMPWPLDRPSWRAVLFSARSSCDGLCIGLSACLATTPLVAWHYGAANLWSPLTSLIVSPPTTLALWLGLPCLFLSGLWPNGPWQGLYHALGWTLDAVVGTVSLSAMLPGASLPVPYPSPLVLLVWPLLFVPMKSGRDAIIRLIALILALALWLKLA
jgi:ComEC/Rec2-related protein